MVVAKTVSDVVAAGDGHPCPNCGSPLRTVRGVEVGNIFKLGTKYSVAMGATYLDEDTLAARKLLELSAHAPFRIATRVRRYALRSGVLPSARADWRRARAPTG